MSDDPNMADYDDPFWDHYFGDFGTDANPDIDVPIKSVGIYLSPDNSESCYQLAAMYADAVGESSVLCAAEFLMLEMEHFTTGEYLGSGNQTEKELFKAAKRATIDGAEYLLIVRG